jgi:ubiquinone/menaquinone biosynthesis C-methylase UbiE
MENDKDSFMSQSETEFKALWNNSAQTYSTFDDSYYPARLKLDLLKKYAKKSFRCLDIGIANGIYSIPLSSFVQFVDGVDISEKMLAKCKIEMDRFGISNIALHNNSAEDLPFENDTYDLVFSFATLAVIPNVDESFREISRVLKPGGFAILDITGKRNLSRIHWGKYYRSIGHFGMHSFSLPDIEKKFESLGFELVENHSIGVMDQWKYIPGLNKIKLFEKLMHAKNKVPDFDYRCSQVFPRLANHWFMAFVKK